MKYIFTILLIGLTLPLFAQIERGLIAYYSFNDCTPRDSSGVTGSGAFVGSPDCVCGVSGNAIELNGFDQEMLLLGRINNSFESGDFTISMYIKSTSAAGTQSLLNKRENCGVANSLGIRLNPAANSISAELSESNEQMANVSGSLDFGSCWQHVVVVRSGGQTQLYINSVLIGETVSNTRARVNLGNNAVMSVGGGACVSEALDNRFSGLVDEIKIYERAFNQKQVASLYLAPDRISTTDTTIFLGNSVNIRTTNSCATDFQWTPTEGLDDPESPNPVASPNQTITYTALFNDGICAAIDSVTVSVIDPDDLDCGLVFLPTAFTPNGDNVNDAYGISNPYAIDDLISMEIFDRWGGRVFATDNPFERWDGNFKGQPVISGVMLYRVRFRCDGEEDTTVGSFSIIR